MREQVLEAGHEASKLMKEHMFREHGEADTPPVMAFMEKGADEYVLAPFTEFLEVAAKRGMEVGGAEIALVAQFFVKTWTKSLDHIIMSTDGYCKVLPEVDEAEVEAMLDDKGEGDFAKEFATQLETSVSMALTTVMYADDLVGGVEVTGINQPYALGDGGVIVWGEVTPVDVGYEGRIPNAVVGAWIAYASQREDG